MVRKIEASARDVQSLLCPCRCVLGFEGMAVYILSQGIQGDVQEGIRSEFVCHVML